MASRIGRLCTLTIPNTCRTPRACRAATTASPPVLVVMASESRVEAAVGEKRLPGDPAGLVAGEVADHSEEVGRRAGALDDRLGDQGLHSLRRHLAAGGFVVDAAG